MKPGIWRLIIPKGSDLAEVYTWRDDAGVPRNLTGYTARAQVRKTHDASVILLEMTTANARIVLGGVAGTIRLAVAAAVTAALSWSGKAVWDLELVDGAGAVTRLLEGPAELLPEVTR